MGLERLPVCPRLVPRVGRNSTSVLTAWESRGAIRPGALYNGQGRLGGRTGERFCRTSDRMNPGPQG